MKMLFLTTRLPFPPVGGEKLRAFNFLKYLSRAWEITLLTFVESEAEKSALKDYSLDNLRVRSVTLPRYQSYLKCLGGFFSREPLETAYYASSEMTRMVKEELDRTKYDLFFCHLIRMAPYVAGYRAQRKVLDMCDAMSLRYSLSSRMRKGPFKFIEYLESKRLERYEPAISKKFDLSFTASIEDKTFLEWNSGIQNLEVVENGLDPEDLDFKETPVDLKKIVFFSNLRTFHNVDAVQYFYKSIFPLIKKRVKAAKFFIVGASIPSCILRMGQDSSVSVLSDAPDIRAAVEDACVSVAPMRVAVGIQNKILQSMAFRVPVVTTTRGLGGIQAKPGRDILIADSPVEFAEKVIMVMENPDLRERLRENAHRLVKEKYFWPNIAEELNKKLLCLI